ncbi:MAG: alanine racemase [Gemmatimonadaceae bacterium]
MTRQLGDTARAWVEIDLDALRRNAAALAGHSRAALCPMVKADAYGAGALQVAPALESLEPWGFGVATVEEGAELREAGIDRPIVVFSPLLPDALAAAHKHRLTPTLGDADSITRWRSVAAADGQSREAAGTAAWHLAIDTGMSRAGLRWDAVGALAGLLGEFPPEGAFTHFHSAERNDESYEVQAQRFHLAVQAMPARPPLLHAENSAAAVRKAPSRWDLIRPGIFLYGVGSGHGARLQPESVVGVRARVIAVRWVEDGETVSYSASYRAVGRRRIATLGIGYGDGYRRALGNRGTVLLRGRRTPVAGVVTMDMTMIDVTDVACEIGDVATLTGADGDTTLDVATVARTADVSPYELLTGLRGRLPRVYAGAR